MWRKLLLSLASLVISLLLFELLSRLYFYGWAALSYEKMNGVHHLGVSGLLQRSPWPGVVYELRPNLDTSFKLVAFRTNSRGLRDREYDVEKPPGTFRIAVIGDSFTMPAAVAIEDAFHSVMEERLNRESPGLAWELLNFGTGGYSLRQYPAVLEHKALPYRPDLALIGFTDNDDLIPEEAVFARPYEVKPVAHSFWEPHLRHWSKLVEVRQAVQEQAEAEPGFRTGGDAERQAYMDRWLGELARLGRENEIPVVIAFLSLGTDKAPVVEALARAHGLPFVDTSTAFQGLDLRQFIPYRLDRHPNAKGHALFADVILAFLREEGLLPRGEAPRPSD